MIGAEMFFFFPAAGRSLCFCRPSEPLVKLSLTAGWTNIMFVTVTPLIVRFKSQ